MVKDIITYLMETTLPAWIVAILALLFLFISFLTIFLKSKHTLKILEFIFPKRKKILRKGYIKNPQNYFHNHPVYDFIDYYTGKIYEFDFGSEFKNNAFKDMLVVKMRTYTEKINEFIRRGLETNDRFILKQITRETILDCLEHYEARWYKLGIPRFDELKEDYKLWHKQSSKFSLLAIQNILNSAIYDDTYERMDEILMILETKFRVTMPDIEKGLREANGKYDNLVYKSKII